MFARVTTYELAEGRASESIDAFQPAIDSVREIEGLVDHGGNVGIAMSEE